MINLPLKKKLESENEGGIVVSDILNCNENQIDPFFTRGSHENLDVYYLSQAYFDLPNN